jgi:signal transduction histidine kinase
MEFFILNEELAKQEAALPGATLTQQVELAWHLRQSNTARALQLADRVEPVLEHMAAGEASGLRLRLYLVRGEASFLRADFAEAHRLALLAGEGFAGQGDAAGCCDAHWLRVCCAFDQNQMPLMQQQIAAMAHCADSADPVRRRFAMACMAFCRLRMARADMQGWVREFAHAGADVGADSVTHPGLRGWIEVAQGDLARKEGDHAMALKHFMQAHALALASAQPRLAQFAALHIGSALVRLDEYQGALIWVERALEVARQGGWPVALGTALVWSADTLVHLQRPDDAHRLLSEAQDLLAQADSPWYDALGLYSMATLELQRGQFVRALSQFLSLEMRALNLQRPRLLARARTGQALTLFHLQRPEQALAAARAVLETPDTPQVQRIDALCLLARIRAAHPDGPGRVDSALADATPLAWLQQALQLAEQRHEHARCVEIHNAIADEYARLGRHDLAYQAALQARAAHAHSQNREARNRALASQISHQSEQARLEQQHHRHMAEAEAQRASLLQQSANTLEYLSAIGQDIMAHLEPAPVFQVLERHLHHLLDTDALTLFLIEPDTSRLTPVFAMGPQADWPAWSPDSSASSSVSSSALLSDLPSGPAAAALVRCAGEQGEVVQDELPGPDAACAPIRSRLFVPLLLASRLLGVLTVGAKRAQAYGAREQLILRTLAGYSAIALSNASAHGELSRAHQHLQVRRQHMIEQGKMAGLGALIAGVAHEINNPASFLHVAAQNLLIDLADFEQFLQALVQEDDAGEMLALFGDYFANLNLHVKTMLNGTNRIANIVQDLRSFSRQNAALRQICRLSEALLSTVNLVRTQWQQRVEFVCEFIDDPLVECWPLLLNQVFMNLLVNGCQAIDEKQRSQGLTDRLALHVRMVQVGDGLHISFEDSGIGIASAFHSRILEPFFTTKAVGSGTGLGLSIAYGIVEKHGGQLSFGSEYGVGSWFRVQLPLPAANALPEPGEKG